MIGTRQIKSCTVLLMGGLGDTEREADLSVGELEDGTLGCRVETKQAIKD
jgi:hypothetical protein